jgi:hypothetical protein
LKFSPALFATLLVCGGLHAQSGFFTTPDGKNLPSAVETTKNIQRLSIHRLDEVGLRTYLETPYK